MSFEYLTTEDKRWLVLRLGNFVSSLAHHHTVEELNRLDRYDLASRTWFHSLSEWDADRVLKFINGQPIDMFMEEIAMWMDERIPKAYKKWVEHRHDTGPGGVPITCDENGNVEYGFIYHYEINLKHVQKRSSAFPKEKILATGSQKSYLEYLAKKKGFTYDPFIFENKMTMIEASSMISYFKSKMVGAKPEKFDDYFNKICK